MVLRPDYQMILICSDTESQFSFTSFQATCFPSFTMHIPTGTAILTFRDSRRVSFALCRISIVTIDCDLPQLRRTDGSWCLFYLKSRAPIYNTVHCECIESLCPIRSIQSPGVSGFLRVILYLRRLSMKFFCVVDDYPAI